MSYVAHRNKISRHTRWLHVQVPPSLSKVWESLTPDQRNSVTSYSWSFLFSTAMLVSLAVITITAQQIDRTTIELAAVESNSDDQSIELPNEIEIEPLDEVSRVEEVSIASVIDIATQELPKLQLPSLNGGGGTDGETGLTGLGNLSGRELGLLSETDRKIAKAGGSLLGPIRISLSFTGIDDLDLHVGYEVPHYNRKRNDKQPTMSYVETYHVYYGIKITPYAKLDVDANAEGIMPEPCENIIFSKKPPTAKYTVSLDNFKQRDEPAATPYVLVIKYGSTIKVLEGNLLPTDRMKVIYEFEY